MLAKGEISCFCYLSNLVSKCNAISISVRLWSFLVPNNRHLLHPKCCKPTSHTACHTVRGVCVESLRWSLTESPTECFRMGCDAPLRVLHEDVFYFFFIRLSRWFCKGLWRVFSVKYILRSNNSAFSNSSVTVLGKRGCLTIIPLCQECADIYTCLKYAHCLFRGGSSVYGIVEH